MREPKILFATDLEGDVLEGLRLATRLARERAATLILLHVVSMDVSDGEAMLYGALDLRTGRPWLRLKSLVPKDSTVPFLHALEVGNLEDVITAFVERERVDMVVMESRRRSLLGRALGRGAVEHLTGRLPCPLVTYRQGQHIEPASALGNAVDTRLASPTEVLTTVLNARIDALLAWMDMYRGMVMRIAQSASVRDAVASLHRASRPGRNSAVLAKIRQLLELELGEHQRALGALGVEVTVDGQSLLRLGLSARHDDPYARFVDQVRSRGGAVSVPLEPASDAPHVSCVALAGAQVFVDSAPIELVFTLDARRDFLRILAQPGPVPSAETYAFDETGVMLSNSRFPDQLRKVGLLPPDSGMQTPRLLRVCDPGGNLLAGEEAGHAALRPLTRMALAATAGQDGCDWTGYRDYRGVEVVGTWRWLSEYGFGVAAEMDRSPA